MTSQIKFHHTTRSVLYTWSCDESLLTLALSIRYDLEILYQSGKRVKTKTHKVLGANSYVCRSYRKKTGKRDLFCSP